MKEKSTEELYEDFKEVLGELEELRLRLKKEGMKQGGIVAAVLLGIGIILDACNDTWYVWTIILAASGGFLLLGAVYSQAGKVTAFYKEKIVPRMVACICDTAQYRPNEGVSLDVFRASGLFPDPDRYACEDLIVGRSGQTEFACSEVHAEQQRTISSGKGRMTTYWANIFHGFLFVADFNKEFKGRTYVVRNIVLRFSAQGMRVYLEDPDFEKRFCVYSTDQIEARYILSTSLMKRITDLDRSFDGQMIDSRMTISFFNSVLVIAIPQVRNHFEASIWKSVLDRKFFEREFNTLKQLIGIIDELNLNLRIWTKQ